MFKAHLRIPTKEMYAYIEIEMEGEVDEFISTYLEATKKYRAASKEKCCDKYPNCSCPQPTDDKIPF